MASPPPPASIYRARGALQGKGTHLHELAGVSKRTVQRWITGRSVPGSTDQATIARALHPIDAALAGEFARGSGQTLESLGLAPRAQISAALVLVPPRRAVDAVLYAAAEAADLPARTARPLVLAALRCMKEAELSIEMAIGVLEEGGPRLKAKPAGRR